MANFFKGEAINELCKGCSYVYFDNTEEFVWHDEVNTKPTDEEIEKKAKELEDGYPLKLLREERQRRLEETDWMGNSDITMSSKWKTYRQELRDLPSTAEPKVDSLLKLTNITWPTKPE